MTIPAAAAYVFGEDRRSAVGVIVNEHTLTAAEVRHHVDVLGRTFDFVHHDDLFDRLERPRPRPFCLLTFDDGKRSGYSEAAPELHRLGVPAVFYLTTGFVGGDTPLWFDRYEALLDAVAPPEGLEPERIYRLPLDVLAARVDRACEMYGVVVDMNDDNVRPMDWAEARALAQLGFTVGAHGVRHAVLTCEPEVNALREIEQSMAQVSRELGSPCQTFAFPNGNYTVRLARHAVHCGARSVMTTDPTWVDAGAPAWQLPRVQLFGSQRRWWIELKLAAAATGRLLVNPNGTGRLYCQLAQRRSHSHVGMARRRVIATRRVVR